MIDEKRDSVVDVNSTEVTPCKIGGHFPGKGGDKVLFCISRDQIINDSRDSVDEIPSP